MTKVKLHVYKNSVIGESVHYREVSLHAYVHVQYGTYFLASLRYWNSSIFTLVSSASDTLRWSICSCCVITSFVLSEMAWVAVYDKEISIGTCNIKQRHWVNIQNLPKLINVFILGISYEFLVATPTLIILIFIHYLIKG